MSASHGSGDDPLDALSAGHTVAHEEHGEGNWLVSYADMMTLLVGFFVILNSFSSIDSEKMEEIKKSVTKEFGGVYQEPFGDMKNRIQEELRKLGLGDQFVIKQNEAGVEIAFHGTVFFSSGSADLKEDAQVVLKKLIPVIHQEASTFFIIVEGHTDDNPIGSGSQFRNNFELSSIRACRIVDAFANHGFAKDHLTAIGYGEARPVVPNRDANGVAIPTNQSQNRRVIIKVLRKSEPTMGAQSKPSTPPSASAAEAPPGHG